MDWLAKAGSFALAAFNSAWAQAEIAWLNFSAAAAFLHLNCSIDGQILATINSIAVAMMVVIFGQPEAVRTGARFLPRSQRYTVDPADVPRVAYNEAVLLAGWLCLFSTLVMAVNRDGDDRVLMVVASALTMVGAYLGTFYYVCRFVHLRYLGAPPADGGNPRGGAGFAQPEK